MNELCACPHALLQVEERGGFIWLFWGDKSLPADERPPIPWAPQLADPSWHAVYGEIEFECGHWGEWGQGGWSQRFRALVRVSRGL
jgi:phenylpropionate dioxygenase-like ring-hydroxylating dioxygenase large terminal subunit